MIDRAIVENASSRSTIPSSLKTSFKTLFLRPQTFFLSKPFFLILSLYTGTYFTANTVDTITSTTTSRPASTVTSGPAKFITTSAANMSLCLYKDSQFAKLFGSSISVPRPVPTASYILFAVRDCLTIFASFNLPAIIAPQLKVSDAFEKNYMSKTSIAQFLAPAGVQIFSTPLHLLGLDLYNRPKGTVATKERWLKVKKDWTLSCLARMGRIIPAFGVGGVVNTTVRQRLMVKLE